jgi:hypothetical protein
MVQPDRSHALLPLGLVYVQFKRAGVIGGLVSLHILVKAENNLILGKGGVPGELETILVEVRHRWDSLEVFQVKSRLDIGWPAR